MSTVNLAWPNRPAQRVSALWLRDNCPCSQCRVPATAEHRVVICTVPRELEPIGVQIQDDDILVDWGDHVSVYTPTWYDRMLAQAERTAPPQDCWPPDFTPPRFAHDDIRGGDTALELEFLRAYCTFGAAIVEGCPTTPGYVEPFIRRWAPPLAVPFDLIHDVRVDPSGYNVAHTAEALPPHNDMASKGTPPSGQILHMLVNDAAGGDSTLVDGFAIAALLSERDRSLLSRVPVSFRQFSDRAETWTRAPLLRIDDVGRIVAVRFSNQLLQALDPRSPDTGPWYEAYHRLSGLILDSANQSSFRLNAGDLLMVHGHRVLHGRMAFQPGTGARHLQDIYFDYEDVANDYDRRRGATAAVT